MNKSILVIDTSENCYNCGIRRGYSCGGVRGAFGMGKDIDDFKLHKPNWCPLKDVPKKKNVRNFCLGEKDFEQKGYQQGYNTCIDEILKRGKLSN